MKKVTAVLTLILLIAFPGPTVFAAPVPVAVLGQVIGPNMTMDGISVPSGTTLLNETMLKTGSSVAAVHLAIGAVLQLGESSSAYFKELTSGEVRVSVETGSLSFREEGEVVTLAADGEVTIPQQHTGKPVTAQQQGAAAAAGTAGAAEEEEEEEEGLSTSALVAIVAGAIGATATIAYIATLQDWEEPESPITR